MTYDEIKTEIQAIMEIIQHEGAGKELLKASERMKALYRNNDVPKDLDDWFKDSDLGAMFHRITQIGILEDLGTDNLDEIFAISEERYKIAQAQCVKMLAELEAERAANSAS